MTVDDVKSRVQAIREVAYDDEQAHGLQDMLYHAVLIEIATGDDAHAELARAVLACESISFSRWFS